MDRNQDRFAPLGPEAIAPDDWEQREVYAKFGLAIYTCQCLETQLVNYLVARQATTAGFETTEAIDEVFGDLFGSPFGRNLRRLNTVVADVGPIGQELREVLALRNDLVHHWMRVRALDQGTSKKRQAMIAELDVAIDRIRTIDVQLVAMTHKLLAQAGITDLVEQEYARLSRISENDDASNPLRDIEAFMQSRRA
jgi:hypothetical protein